ncbi:MAG: DUF1552 domain-containing protein, partial [Myxococcota bacterium]
MNPNPTHLGRRAVLASLGGAAAAGVSGAFGSLVPRTSAEVGAAGGDPCRFVYWYTPVMPGPDLVDGMYPRAPGTLQFEGPFSPLNAISDKCTFVRGLDNRARNDTQGRDGGPHPKGGGTYLTGRAFRDNASGDNYLSGAALGEHSSLDQWLVEQMAEQGIQPFLSDLRLGLRNDGKNGNSD